MKNKDVILQCKLLCFTDVHCCTSWVETLLENGVMKHYEQRFTKSQQVRSGPQQKKSFVRRKQYNKRRK